MRKAWIGLGMLLVALAIPAPASAAPRCDAMRPRLVIINEPDTEWGGNYSRWGNERPTITLNVAPLHNAHGLAWTLRHELGHAQADHFGLKNTERYANAVADGEIPLTCPTRVVP